MIGARLVAGLAILVLVTACGGAGGGESGDPVSGDKKSLALGFEPDEPNPGPGSVALALEVAAGNTAGLRLSVVGASDVYAASVDVTFDPTRVEFADWSAGDLLEEGGQKPFYLVTEQTGRVVIGVSRSGGGPGVDVDTSRTLIRLVFRAVGEGASAVRFENMALLDSSVVPQEIAGIAWSGGTLRAD